MQKVTHKRLETLLELYYRKKVPLFVYGGYGIGKSQTVKRKAEEIAEGKDKELKVWNKLSKQEKNELVENPDGKFVLIDIRLANLDPSDLKGIPNLEKNGAVEWKPPLWVYFISQEGADGFLFLDEKNLAPPSVQSASYQIVHDRKCGGYSISDKIGMFSAGNRIEDKSNVYEMSEALKDRYGEVELIEPDVFNREAPDWTDWAMENGIDSRIVSFLNAKRSYINKPMNEEKNKSTTPRGWARCSELIEDIDNDELDLLQTVVSTSVGEGAAIEFKSFIKLANKFDVKSLLENPETAELPKEQDQKWSVISEVAEYYKKNKNKDAENKEGTDKENLRKAVIIASRLQAEFEMMLLRMVKDEDEDFFKKKVTDLNEFDEIAPKLRDYLF